MTTLINTLCPGPGKKSPSKLFTTLSTKLPNKQSSTTLTAFKEKIMSSTRYRRLPLVASVSVLMTAGVLVCSNSWAQVQPRLPRVALPAGTLPTGAASQPLAIGSTSVRSPLVVAGAFDPYRVSGNTATITQKDPAGILAWSSFDISADAKLEVLQPSATAVLLNKIEGGISPTVIEGMLNAKGHVYIYNPNGIIFGKSATVNVASLLASSLKIDDKLFLTGLLTPSQAPIFSADPNYKDPLTGLAGAMPGAVEVEGDAAQRAKLSAASGGKIMLLAPNVTNNGMLLAPDGQVVLAAGRNVYLAAPTEPGMRGLIVEVNNSILPAIGGGTSNGAATNGTQGSISVGRGNASMIGFAVNQMGSISATTSINLNGSVYLRARAGASKDGPSTAPVSTEGGILTLGKNSLTQIAIYDDKLTAPVPDDPAFAFKKSIIDLSGQNISLQENAKIIAPSAEVVIRAKQDPGAHNPPPLYDLSKPYAERNHSHIDFAAGSLIDVSGGKDTKLAMENNVLEVQLLSELADNVLMRQSTLRGKKFRFDIRKSTNIADISKAIAKIEGTVGERTAAGGRITVISDGEIVQRSGSLMNVSGGAVSYLDGYVNTTKLTADGTLFELSTASANKLYGGLINFANSRRNFEKGYTVGKDGGTVQLSAPVMVLQGEFKGETIQGLYQREVGAKNRALGSKFSLGAASSSQLSETETPDVAKRNAGYQGNIVFSEAGDAGLRLNDEAFDADNNPQHAALAKRLVLNTASLQQAGFSRVTAVTAGDLEVSAPLILAAGGEVDLGAYGNLDFKSGISMPGGSVVAKSISKLSIAPGLAFDLAGQWVNDSKTAKPVRDAAGNPLADVVIQGGKISFSSPKFEIADGVRLDVSAGAWLDAQGKLKKADGGSISLNALYVPSKQRPYSYLHLGSNLSLSGFSFAKGAAFSLRGDGISIGGTPGIATELGKQDTVHLSENFFQQGGFSSFTIEALQDLLLNPGAQITPQALNWRFADLNSYKAIPNGAMSTVATPALLDLSGPLGSRVATNATFDAGRNLLIGTNASVAADPGAVLKFSASSQLTVDGKVSAPAGHIIFALNAEIVKVYNNTRSIWFGSKADISAKGSSALLYTDIKGISSGEMLAGGRISVTSPNYVVAEAGAQFDVSGAKSAAVSFKQGYTISAAQELASAGGSIAIAADEGLLFAGALRASAGGTGAQGGALTIALDRTNSEGLATPRNGALTLSLSNGDSLGFIAPGLQPGQALFMPEGEPQGRLALSAFEQAGFDRISLKSQDELAFNLQDSALKLEARASLILDAPVFSAKITNSKGVESSGKPASVELNSAYVQLGNADYRYQRDGLSKTGNASLAVNSTTLDLIGKSALQGFNNAQLNAKEDIRLVGVTETNSAIAPDPTKPNLAAVSAKGELKLTGELRLKSAQVYPTTLSKFSLNAEGERSLVQFESNGNLASAVLSAAGEVSAKAVTVIQAGQLVAPLGKISLEASQDLTYTSTSVSSVAASGLIPFGRVENGREWVYDFGSGNAISYKLNPGTTGHLIEQALPEKSIKSSAPNINLQKGASLDLSGGGELYAYEFTPGPNGSKDVLKNNLVNSQTTVFAINPNFTASVAPRDFQYGQDGGLLPGDSVTLSGIAGLKAGTYTLLPAHYALLPGGMSISLAPNSRDMQSSSNSINLDKSLTVAGTRTVLGVSDMRTSGWIVSSGEVIRSKSEFRDYNASSYFKEQALATALNLPMLPGDAGRVAFDATQKLILDGQIRLGAANGGQRGSVDISAPEITVVADSSQDTGTALKLVASDLNALGAGSLLLGGLRDESFKDGSHFSVGAKKVSLQNTQAQALIGPEVILAAQDKVFLDVGSAIKGEGSLAHASRNLFIQANQLNGTDGALLRVSGAAAVSIQRDAAARNTGVLEIAKGATVAASGSVYLDATRDSKLDGKLALANGAALGLGSSRVSLGQNIPALADGLRFDEAGLASLSQLSALELNSYSTIDIYGVVNLGNAAMKKLTLKSSGIQGYDQRQVNLLAQTVRFEGGSNFSLSTVAPENSSGQLSVQARDIEFGQGVFSVKAYETTSLNASREARATAVGGFKAEKDLTLAAGRILANGQTDGALVNEGRILATATGDVSIEAGRTLSLSKLAGAELAANAPLLGGRLQFKGDSINSDARIFAPGGQLNMLAKNGININGGELSAAGVAIAFGTTSAYAPAGKITLDGGSGNVLLGANASLDLSAVGAAAGSLAIKANNANNNAKAILEGSLKATALKGVDGILPSQGSLQMDVDSLGDATQFAALNEKLNAAGFTESRSFRVRHDDVDLAAGVTINAHQTLIATDNGNIRIAGTIDASGAKGGSIELYASQALATGNSGKLSLGSSAQLLAYANVAASSGAGSLGDGGRVVLGTASADGQMPSDVYTGSSMSLEKGAVINVSGLGLGSAGSVTFRAPKVGNGFGQDVAISQLDAKIVGSGASVIEAYKTYTTSKISEAPDAANGDGTYSNLQAATSTIGAISYVTDYSKANRPKIAIATATPAGMIGTPAGLMYLDAKNFSENNAVVSRLQRADLLLRAGIEVRSPGDLTVSVNEINPTAAPKDSKGQVVYDATTVVLKDPGKGKLTKAPVALKAPQVDALTPNPQTPNPEDRGWNLNAWRFNAEPGVLSLRAGGDLLINGSISDGFLKPNTLKLADTKTREKIGMPDWVLDNKASWSYRLSAGADLNAANPLAVIASDALGDFKINFARTSGTATDTPVALVRTGTGRIDVAAGRNVELGFQNGIGATIYTAGMHQDTAEFVAPGNLANSQYWTAGTYSSTEIPNPADPENPIVVPARLSPIKTPVQAEFSKLGGAISIYAEHDVVGTPVAQMFNNWLFRQGRTELDASGNTVFSTGLVKNSKNQLIATSLNTAWWSRFDYFNQGIATFGGGDISVIAASGSVKDLSVSVASNAYMPGTAPGKLIEQGGGDLVVKAGADILGGAFYVQKGLASLTADGAILAGSREANGTALRTVLALGDARFDVVAGRALELESAFNPTLTMQSKQNSGLKDDFNNGKLNSLPQISNFSTYRDDSAVHLTSIAGDVLLSENVDALARAAGNDININFMGADSDHVKLFGLQPAHFSAASLSGNLSTSGFTMAGSASGQLDLLAAGKIDFLTNGKAQSIVMLDIAAEKFSAYFAPRMFDFSKGDTGLLNGFTTGLIAHTSGGLHQGDTQPNRVIALTGDINGDLSPIDLVSAKKMEIAAGRDILDFGFSAQHLDARDVTRVVAGRDFIDSTIISTSDQPNPVRHVITGAGAFDLRAGRTIDLGDSSGIQTRGNLENPYLPKGGASINLLAGSAAADYASFVRDYVKVSDLTAADQNAMLVYVQALKPESGTALNLSVADAWLSFNALSPAQQQGFFDTHTAALNKIFSAKLVESSKLKGLAIFDAQIAKMYPNINPKGGNINLFGSQLKTEQGGAIDMFAPGGSVYAGLAETPSYMKKKAPFLGVFGIPGDIHALVKTDFLVNQGRVFTLGGGDITLVSQYGDLNAGKGSRTASSAPEPQLTTDAYGNTVLDISGSISGSGIAALKTRDDQANSNLAFIAPRGTFDAGDAGVRSDGGDVYVNAPRVVNGGNISAKGTISGAPAVDTSALSVVAAPSTAAVKAEELTERLNRLPPTSAGKSTTLSVDVLGYGSDCSEPNCAINEDKNKKN
ncbi:filamentous haemagglutinin family protein [Undibacterium sp.]|uniref:filamentous haemagglutinin family protein n=1 Tax=Undibacterium sp. TaxID=1914977 RepID=UPI0025F262B0|nr:filamentous haemagglutinin family protein [Undibacterium sp.]